MKRVLAFDFGASSGRAILGHFDGEKIRLEEVHRFSNDPVMLGGTFYWDVLRLFHEIKQGLLKAKQAGGFDSVGIDTWGVDFVGARADGTIDGLPRSYRDPYSFAAMDEFLGIISGDELYRLTGTQIMNINSVFQLYAQHKEGGLDLADKILFIPVCLESRSENKVDTPAERI